MRRHSLWLRCDLTVKTLPLSSNFMLTNKGGLVDLRGAWTVKSELWACEFALSSPLHLYYPVECINIAACCNIHLKRSPSLAKAWKKTTVAANGERCKKGGTSNKLWTYADKLINFFWLNGSELWWTLAGKTSKSRKWTCTDDSINFSG